MTDQTQQPDPATLTRSIDLQYPLIGFYDAPDSEPFAPITHPSSQSQACIFSAFKAWLQGQTLHLTPDSYGCGGAGHWLFGIESESRQDFIRFLVDEEGLKASHNMMDQWLDHSQPYRRQHPNLMIGPLRPNQYAYLKSVTFFVNPDQLSALTIGAQYHSAPGDPLPVLAPFGSGCMLLITLFDDLILAQAILGSTDIAMRQYLPANVLAFTVTVPMFEQLCTLDEKSFLHKSFWKTLLAARGAQARQKNRR